VAVGRDRTPRRVHDVGLGLGRPRERRDRGRLVVVALRRHQGRRVRSRVGGRRGLRGHSAPESQRRSKPGDNKGLLHGSSYVLVEPPT
jgi:hypothetical protein